MTATAQRRIVSLLLFAIALPATAYALLALARLQLNAQLQHDAVDALALAARGDTPYHWRFQRRDDLIADRVFGVHSFAFHDGAVQLTAPANAFEIGLPLTRLIDWRRYNRVRIDFDTQTFGTLVLVVRETLDAPEIVSAPISIQPGVPLPELVLDEMRWQNSSGNRLDGNGTIAMLRLRWQLEAGSAFQLRSVRISRLARAPRIDLDNLPPATDDKKAGTSNGLAIYRLPENPDLQKLAVRQLGLRLTPLILPFIGLPEGGTVEEQLALRTEVLSLLPTAIIVPSQQMTDAVSAAQNALLETSKKNWMWYGITLYVLVLLGVRLYPPNNRRIRALLEATAAIAGPLWLVNGGHFGLRFGNEVWVLSAVVAGFILSLRPLTDLARPNWFGTRRSWAMAAIAVFCSLGLVAVLHRPYDEIQSVQPMRFARYIAWALIQQYLICAVLAERMQIVGKNALLSIYVCATLFALLHTPNANLMLATFAGELAWCGIYLRERALLPIAVSHAVCATVLTMSLPTTILRSAEVSARFFN